MSATESTYSTLRIDAQDGVRRVTLNRPEVHNAIDDVMIGELTEVFTALGADRSVRAIVLTGEGKSFCAGADLNWMRRMADFDHAENLADATRLTTMLTAVNGCPKPVVGRINGAALGGGSGITACCDVVIASTRARFSFSEVKLGIIPATISPFVHAKIGASNARRYFVVGDRFDATVAARIGLVHELVEPDDLDARVDEILAEIHTAAPGASAGAKELVSELAVRHLPEVNAFTARLIADYRSRDEAREGMGAFLEKRRPNWSE